MSTLNKIASDYPVHYDIAQKEDLKSNALNFLALHKKFETINAEAGINDATINAVKDQLIAGNTSVSISGPVPNIIDPNLAKRNQLIVGALKNLATEYKANIFIKDPLFKNSATITASGLKLDAGSSNASRDLPSINSSSLDPSKNPSVDTRPIILPEFKIDKQKNITLSIDGKSNPVSSVSSYINQHPELKGKKITLDTDIAYDHHSSSPDFGSFNSNWGYDHYDILARALWKKNDADTFRADAGELARKDLQGLIKLSKQTGTTFIIPSIFNTPDKYTIGTITPNGGLTKVHAP